MFDWIRFLILARQLSQTLDEAVQRTAISRSYFAAYGYARSWLANTGFPVAGRNPHQPVWQEFIDQTDHDIWSQRSDEQCQLARSLGNAGFRLRRMRQESDYQAQYPRPLARDVTNALSEAEAVLDRLNQL